MKPCRFIDWLDRKLEPLCWGIIVASIVFIIIPMIIKLITLGR